SGTSVQGTVLGEFTSPDLTLITRPDTKTPQQDTVAEDNVAGCGAMGEIAMKPWAVSSACPFWVFEAHPERK
ncbi:hypothetical protein BaRGS_00000954, partial [Batillaria attramentaria]